MPPTLHFPTAIPDLSDTSVHLRELTEEDIRPWFERATDIESADLAGDPAPESLAMGVAWLQRQRDLFSARAGLRWAIVPMGSPVSVGTVGLTIKSDGSAAGHSHRPCALGPRYWYRGRTYGHSLRPHPARLDRGSSGSASTKPRLDPAPGEGRVSDGARPRADCHRARGTPPVLAFSPWCR